MRMMYVDSDVIPVSVLFGGYGKRLAYLLIWTGVPGLWGHSGTRSNEAELNHATSKNFYVGSKHSSCGVI